jgi:O-antigen/teichoic acid export membrane protein
MGSKWTEAAPTLSILSILGVLYSIGMPLGSLILAKGRADLALLLNILSFLLNISACLIGSQYGIQSVAMFMVMASALFLLPVDLYLRKKMIDMTISMFAKSLKSLILSFFWALIIAIIISNFINTNMYSSIAVGILSICVFYLYIKIIEPSIINNAINFIRNN